MTVKEIAKHVGVSRATVYRVLNHHPYVNDEVREKVEKLIQEYDCSPNEMGKALALQKTKPKIAVIMSDRTDPFYAAVCSGVYEAYERIKHAGVDLEILEAFDALPGKEAETIRKAIDGKAAAVAICPLEGADAEEAYQEMEDKGIPYVTFASDYKRSNRIYYVGHNNYKSGRVCGYMMDTYLHGRGKVLIVSALIHSQAHKMRLDGFLDYLRDNAPGIEILDYIDHMKDDSDTYYRTTEDLKKNPKIDGVFCVSRGIPGVVKALQEHGMEQSTRIIAFDLTPEHKRLLRDGIVDMVVEQDPARQGRMALEILYEYLISGKKPYVDSYLTDTIITVKESL